MRKQRVKMRVAKSQAPKHQIQKVTVRWEDPSDFLKFLKSMPFNYSLKGFITLRKRHYTDANWLLMCRHTQFLSKTGSIHNFRIYNDRLRIKLRPHNNRGLSI